MTLEVFQNWVIHTGLMVSLLIVIILIIRRPFARAFGANAAYALWSLPLIRLCLPVLSIPQNRVPEFLRQAPVQPTSELHAVRAMTPINVPDSFIPEATVTVVTIQWGAIVLAIWLCVAVLWWAYQLIQQSRFKSNLIAQSSDPNSSLSVEIKQAAEIVGLKTIPAVRIASETVGPFVTGVLKPLVILPNNFEQMFDAQQRHFALVHEFAHIKRGDLWVALTALIFRAVNWPNPLVHYASHKLRDDQEAACDAFVVKVTGGETAHSYAETLVKAVHQGRGTSKSKAHLALSLTQADSENSKGD